MSVQNKGTHFRDSKNTTIFFAKEKFAGFPTYIFFENYYESMKAEGAYMFCLFRLVYIMGCYSWSEVCFKLE